MNSDDSTGSAPATSAPPKDNGASPCNNPDCPKTPSNHKLRILAKAIKRELKRHKLGGRERLVAEWLVDISYGWGMEYVNIPTLEVLGRLVGMPRSNVHNVIKALANMSIVQCELVSGCIKFTVNPKPETWKVQPVVARNIVRETLSLIKELTHGSLPEMKISELEDDPANFKIGHDTTFFVKAVIESVTVTPDSPVVTPPDLLPELP